LPIETARVKAWTCSMALSTFFFNGHAQVASMESRDRVESLGGFEIAAAQEKDQLTARRAQARGDVLERREKVEAAFAFDAIENGRPVEHSRSTLLRIFMRGMGGSLSLMGSHVSGGGKAISHNRQKAK
jgi:hypothetical protein